MFRQRLFVFFVFGFSVHGTCQQQPAFRDLMSCYNVSSDRSELSFQKFLETFKRSDFKTDQAFLRHVVRNVHTEYLKHYKAYAGFPEIFTNGNFDCLTGTALFSLVLTHFEFNYSLIETNYHIFILIHTSAGEMILESTDKHNGLVTSNEMVVQQIKRYKENVLAYPSKNVYRYRFSLYHELRPEQLNALIYFNQAINYFNLGVWEQCAERLDQSGKIYFSPRMEELANLLIRVVSEKENDHSKIQNVISHVLPYSTRSLAGL